MQQLGARPPHRRRYTAYSGATLCLGRSFNLMAERSDADDRAERRAARQTVAAYHQEELRRLLEHVRDGFRRLDAAEIDEFELDDLIHRYKRAASKLWSFCGSSGNGWVRAARALEFSRARNEPGPDWWEEAAPRRRT